jgi:hypothetical protein
VTSVLVSNQSKEQMNTVTNHRDYQSLLQVVHHTLDGIESQVGVEEETNPVEIP